MTSLGPLVPYPHLTSPHPATLPMFPFFLSVLYHSAPTTSSETSLARAINKLHVANYKRDFPHSLAACVSIGPSPRHNLLLPWCVQLCLLTLQLFSVRVIGGAIAFSSSLKCWYPSGLSPTTSHQFWFPTASSSVLVNSHSLKQSLHADNSQTNISTVTHIIFQCGKVS